MSSNRIRVLFVSLLAVFAISAVASASASAACANPPKCEWEQQATEKGAYALLAGTEKLNVEGSGGEFKLKAGTTTVTCTAATAFGFIEKEGKGTAQSLKFTGCTVKVGTGEACKVKSRGTAKVGEIVATNAATQLVERGAAKTLANQFKGTKKGAEEEFVLLEMGKKRKAKTFKMEEPCTGIPATTQVKGQVAGEAKNKVEVENEEPANQTPEEVELNFPEPQLVGNTLEAFGVSATLVGKSTQKLVPGEGFGSKAV